MKAANRLKPIVITMGIALLTAIAINLAMIHYLGQKSAYRAAHSLVGIVMLMGFVYTLKPVLQSRVKRVLLFLLSLLPCYLGTVLPDLDIRLLGIGEHRNPLFHSGIAFFILLLLFRRARFYPVAATISAFGVGIASHLFWDSFDHADVRWIPTRFLDRTWLALNALLCLALARHTIASRMVRDHSGR